MLLLAADFELGIHSLPPDPGITETVGALTTAIVAVITAALALARRVLPDRATAVTILGLSVLASVLSAGTGHISMSLTETAAIVVATAVGIRGEPSTRGVVVVGVGALLVPLAAGLFRIGADVTIALLAVVVWGCAVAAGIAARHLRTRRESALESARRTERMELARELHDVVAHQVSGIVVQAQGAIIVARTDPERAADALADIESAGAEALAGMHRMIGAIREESDSPLTVPYSLADIPSLVDSFDADRERTTLRLEVSDAQLSAGIAESAYRVVREALTNVRRHAPQASTAVDVRLIGTDLVLEIHNDGVGKGAADRGARGFGLTGMAERVTALGGTLRAGPEQPGTWTVHVCLPAGAAR